MFNYKKYKIVIYGWCLWAIFLAWEARAVTIEKFELEPAGKKIKIAGSCLDGPLAVRIFPAAASQPLYTAGAKCQDNKFDFADDLGYWQIPAGDYRLKIADSEAEFKIESLEMAAPLAAPEIIESSSSTSEEQPPAESSGEPDSFTEFLAKIIAALLDWFKEAAIKIKELMVDKITTPELCLGETCLMESQLKELLGKNQISSTSTEFIK